MEINIAKSSGFCFGVRRAIDISLRLSKGKKDVFVLGDIVHNSFVVRELKEKGIKKIRRIKPIKNSPTLIIRAHGAPKRAFDEAERCGYRIVDATCPKVKDIYKIARGLEKNNKIVIIGDKDHDEVKGIAGQLNTRPIIIESPSGIDKKRLSRVKKAAVVTQSTQTAENINGIMKRLKKIVPHLELYDTTCRITRIKQQEIKSLPKSNDVVLIVGSQTSANTRNLYRIAKRINARTHWIESAKDLKRTWFKNCEKTGIMAGASTPDRVVDDIVAGLKDLKIKGAV
jgi:4-hydroxy-3-methylbut-2-enyl diphosphate reductase